MGLKVIKTLKISSFLNEIRILNQTGLVFYIIRYVYQLFYSIVELNFLSNISFDIKTLHEMRRNLLSSHIHVKIFKYKQYPALYKQDMLFKFS